ncbi:cellulase family glycosylhydrolase [Aquimarina gracilis]|uniref:Cellulase family glycosylhydrolase n=1 Tax=Aquimarina gracilis TaxID=874422 RepID=A0ABU5ZWD7_9FLAO|nr:cellulase family glycosylhydrolase [Aquimarina gracilis]MEB3346162.1 cellulase family glycosylhydrolase [Aquimarina gracilis]
MKTQNTLANYVILISFVFSMLFGITTMAQNTPVALNGQLKVCGTQLCNQYNKPIQLRGMSTHGIQWYGWGDCLTESSLDALAYDWEADILRISLYVQEGGYETDPVGFTNQVSRLINEATERGMYALVDWHQLNPGDPNVNLENAKRFFTDIANLHRDKNNIIYDVCNEPNGTGVNWNRIKTYADQIIPVIRGVDNDAVVLVGTHGWATFGVSGEGNLQDVIDNPLQFDNVMYTFHFYAKSHQEAYLNTLDQASSQLPVFVTEFGSQEFTGDGPNDFEMTQRFIDLMRQKKISWTSWNYSDDFRSGAVWQTGTCSGGPWTTSRLKEAGSWIRDKIKFPEDDFPGGSSGDAQSPYLGTPASIPGTIEAENYDLGGTAVAYNDLTPSNQGGSYRTDEVDIEPCSEGGFNIGWVRQGEWLEYTVNVQETKMYTVEARVAAISSGRQFHLEIDNQNISGPMVVPNTGGWQVWQTISANVSLSSGQQVLRVVMDSDDLNLHRITFKEESTVPDNLPPTISITAPQEGTTYTEGQTIIITANAADSDGNVDSVDFLVDGNIIATASSSPFETTWLSTAGNHSISAIAIDNDNASTTASSVTILVESDTGGTSCSEPQYVESGGYVAGSVVQNNGNKYECKPYPFSGWCNGAAWAYAPGEGAYWQDAWTLVGECSGGNPPDGNEPPTTAITSPSNGQSFASGSSIAITASASDTDGDIVLVEFFRNGVKIGEDTSAPYSITWNNVSSGNYTLTTKATDDDNASTDSSPIMISVGTVSPPPTTGLPVRVLNGYWHNFQNGSGLIKLKDVSPNWDVINVSFAVSKVSPTDGEIGFELSSDFDAIGYTDAELKSDIQFLQGQGKKVIISIGGAEGQVQLNTTAARDKFISSMISIIEEYNFDGMDIDFEGQSLSFNLGDTDFENPTTPVIVNTIDAVRNVCDHFGNNFILTMAPETFFVQLGYSFYGGISTGADRRAGAYLPLIHALRDKLTFLQVQYYNSGPITALDDQFYGMGNSDFYVSLVDMLLKGFPITRDQNKFFPALRPDQILIGVPATVNAGNGHTGAQGVTTALDYLIKGNAFGGQYTLTQTYPSLRGVMSWSINWDAFENKNFSNAVRAYLDGLGSRSLEGVNTIATNMKIFTAFPNPVKDYVHFAQDSPIIDFEIEIYNMVGIQVFKQKRFDIKKPNSSIKLNLEDLEPGLYFYTTSINSKSYSGRLIKK